MKVYLSSTLNDLGPERQAVKEALGGECTVVESYTTDERSVRESCLADVAGCNLYIGIIGRRYGFILPGGACSITQLEYEEARKCKVPTLVFIKDDDEIKFRFSDAGTKEHPAELVEAFRQQVSAGTDEAARAALFKSAEDLKSHVRKAYLRLSRRHGEPRTKPKLIEGRPYPGLRAFLPAEADRFFGRDAEIDELLDRLLAEGERFLALIGASGSGKSSLVYAGLIPKLTASPVVAGASWFPVTFSPRELGDDPFQALAAALKEKFPDRGWRVADLMQRLRNSPGDIVEVAKEALGEGGSSAQLLLFVDQFEEVLAGKVDSAARAALFELLAAAPLCPRLRVVIAMRSDFYSQWPQDEASIALLRSAHFPIGVPSQAALEKMIVGPAQAAGLTIAPRLVQRIVDDTGTAAGALALAEFALAQLYDKRQGDTLTETAYDAIGGVAGAIDGLAEEAVRNTEEALRQDAGALDEEVFSRLFLAIASVEEKGEELAVVRRRAAKTDLPGAALTLVQRLVDKRLLVSSEGTSDQLAVFEVGHEAVFSHWRRFKDWYARYAGDLALRRQVERAVADWEKAERAPTRRWGWERQKPVLDALRKLNHLPLPPADVDFTDPGIATWRVLERHLTELPLRRFLHPEPLTLLAELNSDATPHHRREEIGLRLNQFGDPRRGVGLDERGLPEIAWIDVPPGDVTLETDSKDRFAVESFRLARHPVTWSQYRVFLDADDGYCKPRWWEGRPKQDEPGELFWSFGNYPAINVSWYDALAYCRWLGAKLGLDLRLPTEWEWQWAAAGATQQEYPWSGDWNPARANSREAGILRTVAAGLYPRGRSPFGLEDMAGNIWEWCLNAHREPSSASLEADVARVVRGGSWHYNADSARAAARSYHSDPDFRSVDIGFRVLCSFPVE